MIDIYGGHDPRDIPAYSIFEASRYLLIPAGTLRSWLLGRHYQVRNIKKFSKPLIELPNPEVKQLSFNNLVEAHVLRVIRLEHRITLPRVRMALDYLEQEFRMPHPLVRAEFQTDGVNLFLETMFQNQVNELILDRASELAPDSGRMLINASRSGQLAIQQTLKNYLKRIERDEAGLAARLFPFTRDQEKENDPRIVVIDPRISFGRPVLVGTGIPTLILAQRYKAGDSIEELAHDYDCDHFQIEEAIRCELQLAA